MSDTADPLAAKLDAILSKLDNTPDDDGEGKEGPVSYPRFYKVNEQRKAAVAALQELKAEYGTVRQQAQAAVQETATAWEGKLQQAHAGFELDLQLGDMGLDRDGRAVLKMAWQGQPEEARGDSPAAWWKAVTTAHSAHLADPEKAAAVAVPKPLTPYLPAPAVKAPPSYNGASGSPVIANLLSPDRGVRIGSTTATQAIEGARGKGPAGLLATLAAQDAARRG